MFAFERLGVGNDVVLALFSSIVVPQVYLLLPVLTGSHQVVVVLDALSL